MLLADERQAAALVLVVDDVIEIVEELVELLDLLDMPAAGAHSLAEAMAVLERETSIRVIACDVRLSRESGLEIIPKVAAHPCLARRNFKYLFMTGDPMRPDAIEAQQYCPVLTKPVPPGELVPLLRQLLELDGLAE